VCERDRQSEREREGERWRGGLRPTALKTNKQAGRKSDKLTKRDTKKEEVDERERERARVGRDSPQPRHALAVLIT